MRTTAGPIGSQFTEFGGFLLISQETASSFHRVPISIERLPRGWEETSSNRPPWHFQQQQQQFVSAQRCSLLPSWVLCLRNFTFFYKLNRGCSFAVLFCNWLYSADMHISITVWTGCCITACMLRPLWCDRFVLFGWSSEHIARYRGWLVRNFVPLEKFRRQLMFIFWHHIN